MNLNDVEIREALLVRLRGQAAKPKAIIEELRVHNGQAVADVVALYNEAHCYEIKGENDKIERIIKQGAFYNSAFRKITLVTTERNLNKALHIAPPFWGIMLASLSEKKVKVKYIRKATINPFFQKDIAVLTLWKSEMLSIIHDGDNNKRKTRAYLAKLISETKKKSELSSNISELLLNRYAVK